MTPPGALSHTKNPTLGLGRKKVRIGYGMFSKARFCGLKVNFAFGIYGIRMLVFSMMLGILEYCFLYTYLLYIRPELFWSVKTGRVVNILLSWDVLEDLLVFWT